MKKVVLTVLAATSLIFGASAQTEKGKVLLGGTVGVALEKNEVTPTTTIKSTTFHIVPNVGFFVKDNLALGTGVGYQFEKTNGASQSEAIAVQPFLRQYANISDKFKFFGQLSVPMSFGNIKEVDDDGHAGNKLGSFTGIGGTLSPGFAFFPSQRLGIELSLQGINFQHITSKPEGSSEKLNSSQFNLGANFFAPQIGIQFYL